MFDWQNLVTSPCRRRLNSDSLQSALLFCLSGFFLLVLETQSLLLLSITTSKLVFRVKEILQWQISSSSALVGVTFVTEMSLDDVKSHVAIVFAASFTHPGFAETWILLKYSNCRRCSIGCLGQAATSLQKQPQLSFRPENTFSIFGCVLGHLVKSSGSRRSEGRTSRWLH